ncbi:MAG: hypothetical protein HYS81_00775 [Candidatus Aenigmatarchaeota archaeon]|nr:MAG: hypothetical protein HYS81_00775 [Candidatus Aenigmarchaeota archaeon]
MKGQIVTNLVMIAILAIMAVASIGFFICVNVGDACSLAKKGGFESEVTENFLTDSQAQSELNAYLAVKDMDDNVATLWLLYKTTGDAGYKDRAKTVYETMFANRQTRLFVDRESFATRDCSPELNDPSATRKIPLPSGQQMSMTLGLCR